MKKFINFCKALKSLKSIDRYDLPLNIEEGENAILISGLVNFYNICFELSWKVMKERLLWSGYDEGKVGSPRTILKIAFTSGMIKNESLWLNALKDRNETAHIYDVNLASELLIRVKTLYVPMFEELKKELETNWECCEEFTDNIKPITNLFN